MLPPDLRTRLARLEGLLPEPSGLRLAELASEVPSELAIVEVGSFKGKSACYLAAGAASGHGARVFAVDAWDLKGNETGRFKFASSETRETFGRQVREMNLEDRVTPIRAFSVDAAREFTFPVGLLFIDASHVYRDVRRDYEAWSPHVVPGGTVVFDDCAEANPGVERLVRELVRAGAFSSIDLGTPPLAVTRKP